MTFLSIIIPTLNEEKTLELLLSDLQKQTYQDFEVIIADANSKDKTTEIAKKYGATLVEGGIAAVGRNNGAKIAKGNWFLFLDADIRMPSDTYLEESINQIKQKDLKIAHSRYSIPNDSLGLKILYSLSDFPKEFFQFTPFAFCSGNCVWVEKETFKEVGGFPEIKIAEDQKFVWNVTTKGNKFRLLNQTLVPNTRRYKKYSPWEVTSAFIVASVIPESDSRLRKWVDKVYGEFGKFEK